jgi:uncharacterized protein YbjT (DUF2867 family)
MPASFVVAGATGRVGSVVASELLSRGASTTVIVRGSEAASQWEARGATAAVGSLSDRDFLARTLHGASGFFVLLPENVPPDDFHGHRRRMAEAIAGAAAASAVPHVVVLSAIAASLADGNGPAKDLHYLERLLSGGGARLSVLRSCYFQDNVADAIPPAMGFGIYPNFLPSADAAFPMVATRDVGRVAAAALLSPPSRTERVLVLGPAYSIGDIARRLGAALGKPLQVADVPPDEHVPTLVRAGVPAPIAEALAEMFGAFARGLIVPEGDRQVIGSTTVDEVITVCLKRASIG